MINQYSFGSNPIVLARKSITAYFMPMGIWFIVWATASSISGFLSVLILAIGIMIVMHIRSYTLFVDEEGVWVFKGIFPWSKGIYGVKWRDFGEAVFFLNPVSWSLRSYTIHATNKFKPEEEIVLSNMHKGDIAVSKINAMSMQQ